MIAWYHLVDKATSSLEIVAASRDYFASWTPQEISMLPERCRPGKVRDASDIEFLHDLVVDEYRNSHASGEQLSRLQELTTFLVRAAQRLAEIADRGVENDAAKAARRTMASADSPES